MKTKNPKNPLYVVKGKTVHEASGVFDLLLKKFNLEPVAELLMKMVNFLLGQVKDYPTFLAVKKAVDELVDKINKLGGRFRRA